MDVAVAWGPLAGYAARTSDAPLELVPLEDEPGVPLSFDISMGVAKGNDELKGRLEAAIDRREAEIRAILEEYGVPLVPAAGELRRGPPQRAVPAPPPLELAARTPPPAAAEPGPTPASAAAPSRLNPFTGDADMAAEGRTLYFQVGCQGCHGGGGGGGMATSVIDDAWTFGSDDEVLFRLIKGEIPEQTMPTVYSVLEDEEVWKILAFIRSVYAGDPGRIRLVGSRWGAPLLGATPFSPRRNLAGTQPPWEGPRFGKARDSAQGLYSVEFVGARKWRADFDGTMGSRE